MSQPKKRPKGVYAECDVAEVLERNRRCPASA